MKILLVNPPWFDGERQGVRAGSRWPHLKIPEEERYMPYPFFLGYSSSLLKINNFNVKCIDAIAEHMSYEEFKAEVKNYNPDIILSETSTPSVVHDMALLKELKDEFKPFVAKHLLFTFSTIIIFFCVILLSRFRYKTWCNVLHHFLLMVGLFTVLNAGFYGGELVHRFNLPAGIGN